MKEIIFCIFFYFCHFLTYGQTTSTVNSLEVNNKYTFDAKFALKHQLDSFPNMVEEDKHRRLIKSIEFGFYSNGENQYFGTKFTGGYKFNTYLVTSLGLGTHQLSSSLVGFSTFVRVGGNPDWPASIYYSAEFGYTLFNKDMNTHLEENKKEGDIFVAGAIGFRINTRSDFNLVLALGYNLQNVTTIESKQVIDSGGNVVSVANPINKQLFSTPLIVRLIF